MAATVVEEEGVDAPPFDPPSIAPTDPADVLWTSGTTGRAKAFSIRTAR
jgi:acyl-coenzyme A synthetase/AMP-(fatty) acid ligase